MGRAFDADELALIDRLILAQLARREGETSNSIARLIGYGSKTVERRLWGLRRAGQVVTIGCKRICGQEPLVWRLKPEIVAV